VGFFSNESGADEVLFAGYTMLLQSCRSQAYPLITYSKYIIIYK